MQLLLFSLFSLSSPHFYSGGCRISRTFEYDFTAVHTKTIVSISGSVMWDDDDNRDGIRPKSVTVALLAGRRNVSTATATAENCFPISASESLAVLTFSGHNNTLREVLSFNVLPEGQHMNLVAEAFSGQTIWQRNTLHPWPGTLAEKHSEYRPAVLCSRQS
ncbi:MAG TPA: hypothetical protein DHV42_00460 [Lachnospiraceae bacterium]|nr:hypothetical protein [Lachnospiraceae bacterium]